MTKRKHWSSAILLAIPLLLLAAGTATGGVELRFTPLEASVDPGAGGRLSLMIDDPIEVRTIDLVVSYDPEIVLSITGDAGALFTDSGVFTFKGFENDTPGQWHGYAVVMGAGLFVQGPGELFYWDFEGLEIGRSWIDTISVALAATDGSWYEAVTLGRASIIVGHPSGIPNGYGSSFPALKIAPNPFNPTTTIELPPGDGESATLSVIDTRGRLVKELWSGLRTGETTRFSWNGRTRDGLSAVSGNYLFVLRHENGSDLVGRGCLVR